MTSPYEKYLQMIAQQSNTAPPQKQEQATPSSILSNHAKQPTQALSKPIVPQQSSIIKNNSSFVKSQVANKPRPEPQERERQLPQSLITPQIYNKDLFKLRAQVPINKTSNDQAQMAKTIETNFKAQSFSNFDHANRLSNGSGGGSNNNKLNATFDKSLLFKTGKSGAGGSSKKNQFFRGGGGGNFWRNNKSFTSSTSRKSERGEKLIVIELVGPNTIALKFENFFDNEIKEKIKSFPDAKYEGASKEWFLRKDLLNDIINSIGESCIDQGIKIVNIPDFVYDLSKNNEIPFTHRNKNLSKDVLQMVSGVGKDFNYEKEIKYQKLSIEKDLPDKIKESLYDFQKKGIEFGISRFGRVLIGDEMGVGKTIQALSIAYLYKKDWPLLILAPSSLRYTWKDEIAQWIPTLNPNKDIQVFKKGKDVWSTDACIFIMSYDLATKRSSEIEARSFACAIADEAHYLKSRDSKRSQNLVPILMKSKRTILLSGTPILSRPVELYNLMKAVRPDLTPSFNMYASRYCNPKDTPYGLDYSGNACTKELHYLISQSFMIRRLKKDVLSELPEKRRQKIKVQIEDKDVKEIRKLLNGMLDDVGVTKDSKDDYQTLITDYGTNFTNYLKKYQNAASYDGEDDGGDNNAFMRAYRKTGESKVSGMKDFIETLIDNNCKFIIFAHHLTVLDELEKYIQTKKVGYIRMDGKVSMEQRHQRVKAFQGDDSIRIALLSITACSQGLTLTAASTIVFAELFWTPSIMTQAEDRAHRIGQQNAVNIYYMHGEDTLDDLIFQILSAKSQVVSDALDGKVSEYRIAHAKYEEIKDDVKERKEKGTLNPSINKEQGQNTKKAKIDDFFAKQKDLNNFVKKRSKSLEDSREEEIESSELEDALVISNEDHSDQASDTFQQETEKIVKILKKNPKKRKLSKDKETKPAKKRRIQKDESEDDGDDEFIL